MREKLLKIYTHFGRDNQLSKLHEEVLEFEDAVLSGDIDNIMEEMADIFVVLDQFAEELNMDIKEVFRITEYKIDRTLDRIERGYYDAE